MEKERPYYQRGLVHAKPGWKSGKTVHIRVPEILRDKITAYARQLDEQWAQQQQQEKSE